jgi:hypothetical protein
MDYGYIWNMGISGIWVYMGIFKIGVYTGYLRYLGIGVY